jgi:hypothetical protein
MAAAGIILCEKGRLCLAPDLFTLKAGKLCRKRRKMDIS